MIPKTIHYCWFGKGKMPKEAIDNIRSCTSCNPSYQVIIWNEENFDVNTCSYVKEAYEAGKWAFVTDYVRLYALFHHGGIYMDTDVEVIKPLDPLLTNHAFSGFESYSKIPTGTMGSEPQNKWIGMLLDYYKDKHFVLPDGKYDLTTNVETITTITKENYPIVLNNTFQDLGDVTFYPFDYLCAKDVDTGEVLKTENTFTVHHFAGSWQPQKGKIITFLRQHRMNKIVDFCVFLKKIVKRIKK